MWRILQGKIRLTASCGIETSGTRSRPIFFSSKVPYTSANRRNRRSCSGVGSQLWPATEATDAAHRTDHEE